MASWHSPRYSPERKHGYGRLHVLPISNGIDYVVRIRTLVCSVLLSGSLRAGYIVKNSDYNIINKKDYIFETNPQVLRSIIILALKLVGL